MKIGNLYAPHIFRPILFTIIGAMSFAYIASPVPVVARQNETIDIAKSSGPATTEMFVNRRARVLEDLGNGLMVLFGAQQKVFSNDINYPYRQESNLYYLTGINQPGATLVLVPGNRSQKEILFLPERDPTREIWTGQMLGVKEVQSRTGIIHVWPEQEFDNFIKAVLEGSIYERRPSNNEGDYQAIREGPGMEAPINVWLLADAHSRYGERYPRTLRFALEVIRFPTVQIRLATNIFRELRSVKSPWEVEQLQRAIDITCLAQRNIMNYAANAKGILNESVLDGIILSTYRRYGAHWGFPSIVASGPNTTTLHYEKNSREMAERELILADIGAAVGNYTADITRTFPRNGVFTEAQRAVYEVVLDAQTHAIAAIRPGMTIRRVHEVARKTIVEGLWELGLITNKSGNQYRMWFMHGTSHWLGLDVHDVGGRDTAFKPGMVITVEPGIYVREDTLNNLKNTPQNRALIEAIRPAFIRYKNIGIRIEDDVLVTEKGHRVLSARAPRTIEAIETLMAESAR